MQNAKLKEFFKEADLKDYKGIPFWSWNNSLDEDELLKQIEQMKSVGLGGFIMHARTGLKDEYLGEKWFHVVSACLKKAKELNMNGWIYDENGWPSGFVGGKLLENVEFRAQFLEYKENDYFDESAFGVYKECGDDFVRIFKDENLKTYHTVYLRTSPANTDILNPKVVDAFIKETHEKYYQRFKDSFGKELTGFFTDEPQYYRWGTPYSVCAKELFKEKYNEDIVDGLIYLFKKCSKGYNFRFKYFKALNYLYVNNYYKKLYDWCEEHGCKLTGHSVEETALFTQMWGGAGCMPSYEYEHIPGVDCLCRDPGREIAPKQVGSVASQLGIKHVLTETFGCSGYDATPFELKSIGDFQFFNGVNLMCHHLYPYSLAGQGKVDHPPVFSAHSNWVEGFKEFNDYFTRLGYIVANTKENYQVLVIHPLRDVYLDYIRSEDYNSVRECEDNFTALLMKLRKNGILYQLADESILERHGKVLNDKIIIGNNSYNKIYLPKMKNISRSTLNLLNSYKGKILVEENPCYVDGNSEKVNLKSNMNFEDIIKNYSFKFYCEDGRTGITSRSGEIGNFLFIKNYDKNNPSEISMENVAENYLKIDLNSFETSYISNEMKLEKGEGIVLIKDEGAKEVLKAEEKIDVTNNFKVENISENYIVSDFASYSFDGNNYSDVMPIPQLFEKLLRDDYKGKLFIKHKFLSDIELDVDLIMEKANLESANFNGEKVEFSKDDFDVNFKTSKVNLKKGENIFIYSLNYYQHDGVHFALFDKMATESLRNCLYYDTEIENVYLKGNFNVEETSNGFIVKKAHLPETLTTKLCENGYPFFKGKLTINGFIDYNGGNCHLELDGRFMVADISVNDKNIVCISNKVNLENYLNKGKNNLKITIKSSLRNLFGPHHFKPLKEPMGVSPYNFTMRGTWENGVSNDYTFNYNFVDFGIDKIYLVYEK